MKPAVVGRHQGQITVQRRRGYGGGAQLHAPGSVALGRQELDAVASRHHDVTAERRPTHDVLVLTAPQDLAPGPGERQHGPGAARHVDATVQYERRLARLVVELEDGVLRAVCGPQHGQGVGALSDEEETTCCGEPGW